MYRHGMQSRRHKSALIDRPVTRVLMGFVYIFYWHVATERIGGQFIILPPLTSALE